MHRCDQNAGARHLWRIGYAATNGRLRLEFVSTFSVFKFIAGFIFSGLALVSLLVAISQPSQSAIPDHVAAVGFPAGTDVAKVALWGEHLDPSKRHNAPDVDGDRQAVFLTLDPKIAPAPKGQ